MLLPLLLNLAPVARVSWLQSSAAVRLTADAGAFALAGPDAGLVFGGATVTARVTWLQGFTPLRLVADAGAFTLAGADAGLVFGSAAATARVTWLQSSTGAGAYQLLADAGAFVYSGAASLSDFEVAADGGIFGMAGGDAALTRGGTPVVVGYTLTADVGAFVATGRAATLRWWPAAAFTAAPGSWRLDSSQARVGSQAIRPGTVRVGGAIINRS
jgi:hypothetical protein